MKVSYVHGVAVLALAQRSAAFVVNQSHPSPALPRSNPLKTNEITGGREQLLRLFSSGGNGAEDINDYLGGDKSPEAGLAFLDIINDDMPSLEKRLENGLNPDTRFFQGNTILHLIALKGSEKSLDEKKYVNILSRLLRSGADLEAKNDKGSTALEFCEFNKSNVFSEKIRQAQRLEIKVSLKKDLIDAQLSTFSLQKGPTTNGKKWIVALIKMGANHEHVAPNGRTIIENISDNWPEATVKAFNNLVVAAKFKSAANGYEKASSTLNVNEQWVSSVMEFYKAK